MVGRWQWQGGRWGLSEELRRHPFLLRLPLLLLPLPKLKGFTTTVTQPSLNNSNSNTLAKIAISSFELHYSYTVQLVNMRVSWIMNMPTCDTRVYNIRPRIRPWGLIMCAISCSTLGHSLLLPLGPHMEFNLLDLVCPALYWILAKRATPGLRSNPYWAVSRLLDLPWSLLCA